MNGKNDTKRSTTKRRAVLMTLLGALVALTLTLTACGPTAAPTDTVTSATTRG